ncbi:hypothetical protein ACFX13_043325 [Malus domestica]|uniref:ZF-HD dimerization-type domain-containing protein n=1 Tax=Malus domestica TaxID=3750 RepID=A0A498J6Q9_MALDO|nr:hypothetical protein DVH24_020223 [Malus domestica]
MDFRAQDNEMRTSGSLSYAHLNTKESSPSPAAAADHQQKRRVGIHNGTGNYGSATAPHHQHQTLDNHHPAAIPLQPLIRDPDPDRALSGTPVAPHEAGVGGGGGGPKSLAKVVRYRECLKNHAANIGGNVFDGCGEFMPSGQEGTMEALKCAACDCHRNFHRKEVDGETAAFSPGSRRSSIMLSPLQLPPPLPSPSSALHHHHHHHHHQKYAMPPIVQPVNVAFGSSGGGTESSSEDLNAFEGGTVPPFALSKKRFRTKFTVEQKERMMEFGEKVGWRIQKQDEEEVERFCAEVGVKRQVLRVWMHNNKNTIKKQGDVTATTNAIATGLSFKNVEGEGGEGGAAAED